MVYFLDHLVYMSIYLTALARYIPFKGSVIHLLPMGVDHGGDADKSPPRIWVGGTLVQIVPLRFLSYRYKKERSVAFKIRQNPFSAGALPRTPLGELTIALPRPPSRLKRGHPHHTPPHSAPTHLRRSPCVPLRIPARSTPMQVLPSKSIHLIVIERSTLKLSPISHLFVISAP